MFTNGITKIFSPPITWSFETVSQFANKSGYFAFQFCGDIYVKNGDGIWILTCFVMSDFEVSFKGS